MTEITQLSVDLTLDFYDSLVSHARAVINGNTIDVPIERTIRDANTLRKYVLFSDERGLIERVALVDAQGRELYVKHVNYQKGSTGYMVVFPITQKIEVSQ